MDYRAGERMEDWLTTNHVLSSHFPGHFSLYPLSSYTTAKNNALWDSTQLHGEYVLGCLDRVASQYHRQVKDRPALHGLFLWRKSNYWMNNEAKLLQIGWDWVECRCPFLYTVTHTRSKNSENATSSFKEEFGIAKQRCDNRTSRKCASSFLHFICES